MSPEGKTKTQEKCFLVAEKNTEAAYKTEGETLRTKASDMILGFNASGTLLSLLVFTGFHFST